MNMARLQMPPEDALTAEQAQACAEVRSGLRGKVPAPMVAWLRSPDLARRGQRLGELLRFETTLEPVLTELAILVCGRHWTSHHEWKAHKALALQAGLDPRVADDIAARRAPVLADARQQLVYTLASTLLASGRIPAPLYAQGLATLGERGLVELVGVLGYYCMVSLTLNAFELGLPEGAAPELQDPDLPATGAP